MGDPSLLIPSPRRSERLAGTVNLTAAAVSATDHDPAVARIAGHLKRRLGARQWQEGSVAGPDEVRIMLRLDESGDPRRPRADSYVLHAEGAEVSLHATSAAGLSAGVQTLLSLATPDGSGIPAIHIEDWPVLPFRAVHLDFRAGCLMPSFPQVVDMIQTLAAYKINAVVVEWEDKFPFRRHPELASAETLSDSQIRDLLDIAAAHEIKVIPLLQSLGHVEYLLRHPQHAHLREKAGDISQLCPSEEGSRALVLELMDELLEAMPDADFVHLGGDETWLLGSCPRCSAKAREDSLLGLYVDHIAAICEHALQAGRIPMIFGDVVLGKHVSDLPGARWSADTLRAIERIPRDVRMVYWDYAGTKPADFPHFEDYERLGFKVWVAPATRFADIVPDYALHLPNITGFIEAGSDHGAEGAIITSWAWKNMPVELTWHGLISSAQRAWSGPDLPQTELDRRATIAYFGCELPEFVEAIYLLSYDYTKRPYEDRTGEPVRSSYLTINAGVECSIPDPESVRADALRAATLLRSAAQRASLHTETLEAWVVAAKLVAHVAHKQLLFDDFDRLVADPARQLDRSEVSRLRRELGDLADERERLAQEWQATIARTNVASTVEQDIVLRFAGERTHTVHALEQLRAFGLSEGRRVWR